MALDLDKRVTIGNIMTMVAVVISLICSVAMYMSTIDQHTKQIGELEAKQNDLHRRIAAVEEQGRRRDVQYEKLQADINRTVTYLQLLLDKQGIQYVK